MNIRRESIQEKSSDNTVVFGLGRSGTNSLAETLSLTTHQSHHYLKEYFSDNWALSVEKKIVPAGSGTLDFNAKYSYIKNLNAPWLFNCTPYSVNDQVLDLMTTQAEIYLIKRDNLQDVFLSHVLAWFGNRFYQNNVSRQPASIWINEAMFEKYRAYYEKYQSIVDRISPTKIFRFEDTEFHGHQYLSQYNLVNRMDYIENKQDVIDFIARLQVSTH